MRFWHLFIVIIISIFAMGNLQAQESDSVKTQTLHFGSEVNANKPLTRILFIFDSSQSMLGRWNKHKKIDLARNLLMEMMDSIRLLDNVQVALRVYGHQHPVPPQNCSDTRLEVAFDDDNYEKIQWVLEGLVAKGTTPIARSLEEAGEDFPDDRKSRNIIVLITDGVEACDGDPCAVSLALQRKGVVLKPFVIGLGLDVKFEDVFNCVGVYYNATNPKEFKDAMRAVVDQVTHTTSAQVNLLDSSGHPTETNVNMSFHDHTSGGLRYNYMHTINKEGMPDTVLLDILTIYDLKVHTIPPVTKDSIVLKPDTHNIIPLKTPQGYIQIKIPGGHPRDSSISCIIRKNGEGKTLHVQKANSLEKYITGIYDVEILSLPRRLIENVMVQQSKISNISIPQPGDLNIQFDGYPIGCIMSEHGDRLESIYRFDPHKKRYHLRLLPGNYRISVRYADMKKTKYTMVKRFSIGSGKTLQLKFDKE